MARILRLANRPIRRLTETISINFWPCTLTLSKLTNKHTLLIGQNFRRTKFSLDKVFRRLSDFRQFCLMRYIQSPFSFLCSRYAFKLGVDSQVVGEVGTDDELLKLLTDYEDNWYMGEQNSEEWVRHVINEKHNLLSVYRDEEKVSYFTSTCSTEISLVIGLLNTFFQIILSSEDNF